MRFNSEVGRRAAAFAVTEGRPNDVDLILRYLDMHCLGIEEMLEGYLPAYCAKHPGPAVPGCGRCQKKTVVSP